MSIQDQEHTLQLVSMLLKKRGAGRVLAFLLLAPFAISSLVAVITYNVAAVSYLHELNKAARNTPVLVNAMTETRDTLTRHGFQFGPLTFVR